MIHITLLQFSRVPGGARTHIISTQINGAYGFNQLNYCLQGDVNKCKRPYMLLLHHIIIFNGIFTAEIFFSC